MELFDQSTVPVAQVAVKVKIVGEHTIGFTGGVTTGIVGLDFICRFTTELASDSQPLETHLAVIA